MFDMKTVKPYGLRLETLLKAAKDQNSDEEEFKIKMKTIRDTYLEAQGEKELVTEEILKEKEITELFMKDYHSRAGLVHHSELTYESEEEEPQADSFINQLDLMSKRVKLFQKEFGDK